MDSLDAAQKRECARMNKGGGFLAIWSDVSDENETDYLHWLTREHTEERLSVPGFLGVRVFRARLPDVRRYFILYELASPEVVGSAAYLERLNNPTPWSRRIMPILGNFARGGGRCLLRDGCGAGAIVAPHVIPATLLDEAVRRAPELAARERIASVHVLVVDRTSSEIPTDEKAIRSGDRTFDGMLLVEALDGGALASALEAFAGGLADTERASVYDQVFSLCAGDLA
jgi:hypothetical protein